jgi:hypothetical protein
VFGVAQIGEMYGRVDSDWSCGFEMLTGWWGKRYCSVGGNQLMRPGCNESQALREQSSGCVCTQCWPAIASIFLEGLWGCGANMP